MVWILVKMDRFVVKMAIFASKLHFLYIFYFKSLEFLPDFSLFLQKLFKLSRFWQFLWSLGFDSCWSYSLWFKIYKKSKKSENFKNFGFQIFSESILTVFWFSGVSPSKDLSTFSSQSPLDRARLDTEEDGRRSSSGARHDMREDEMIKSAASGEIEWYRRAMAIVIILCQATRTVALDPSISSIIQIG